ncbi:MAG: hypothetical protein ACJAYB_003527 [Psychromonas sp.]|jgi:hypothetical protein
MHGRKSIMTTIADIKDLGSGCAIFSGVNHPALIGS